MSNCKQYNNIPLLAYDLAKLQGRGGYRKQAYDAPKQACDMPHAHARDLSVATALCSLRIGLCPSLFSATCRCTRRTNTGTYRLVLGLSSTWEPMMGGHYIAYVRACKIGGRQQQSSGSKSWLLYASDGEVRETSLEEVLDCEAYVLFYERVGD
jgi:hypothetical protein